MKKTSEVYDIIYSTLEPYLSPKDLTTAITIWEDNYSQLSQLRLNAFINDIKSLGSVDENRQTIYRLVTKQLLESETAVKNIVDKPQSTPSLLCHTFILFAKAMLNELRTDHQAIAISHVQTLLRSKQVSAKNVKDITTALKSTITINCDISPKILRQSINQIYIVTCELIGPVQADVILNKAVTITADVAPDIKRLI